MSPEQSRIELIEDDVLPTAEFGNGSDNMDNIRAKLDCLLEQTENEDVLSAKSDRYEGNEDLTYIHSE